jgi:DNA repair exonuclease SbcCD ATPase subunit
MLSCITRTLILGLAFFATVDHAWAQATLDADAKELRSYTLTTTALKQFAAATRNMMTAAKADPRFQEMAKLKAEVEKLEAKEEPTEADEARLEALNAQIEALEAKLPNMNMADARLKTLSDIEAAIKKEPLVLNALNSAGMAPRDYAKFALAFFQAAMLHGMQKSGMIKEVPKDLQATVNMDNVKFIEANQAEISALMAEFQAAPKP